MNKLLYVNISVADATSRIIECDKTAPYKKYPQSCTDRSFRTLGLITDKTFKVAIDAQRSRTHAEITNVLTTVCSNPVSNVIKSIPQILDELPMPKQGEVSACAVYLEYSINASGNGHTVIFTKNDSGITTINDISTGELLSGTPEQLINGITNAGYNNARAFVSVVEGDDDLNIKAVGVRKYKKSRKNRKPRKNVN